MSEQDITALVSSRICHDLISPIGAISNGVELLSEVNGSSSPELGLIGDSVNSAAEKLRCFRIAFGAVQPGAVLPLGEVEGTLRAMFQGRSSVTVQATGSDMPRTVAKALMLTLLCQERCLPLGGSSHVKLGDDGFIIDTSTSKIRDVEYLWSLVERAECGIDIAPSEVQFLLLGELLAQQGATLTRDSAIDRLTLQVSGLKP